MSKAIEVFNRHEKKYMLTGEQFNIVQEKLTEHMELDAYNQKNGTYSITNIYYDTCDDHLIRTSLAKPKYKEKLRLRAYGVPSEDTKVYVEIKKKVCGIVNKRRSSMKLNEAYKFLETGKIEQLEPYMNKQVLKEIQYMLSRQDLQPKLYLSYERKAFFDKESRDLRVSFDTNIRTRRYDLRLEAGSFGSFLLNNDNWLMEIKSEKCMPLWLAKMLSEYCIYPTSFSKYGTEYKNMVSASPRVTASHEYKDNGFGILVPAI